MKFYGILFIIIMASFSLIAQVAIAPATGDGTEQSPYEIASLENLYWIAASDDVVPNPEQAVRWSSHYVQTADIDASDTENWFDGLGWSSIGTATISFSGSYNGQDYTIDALFVNRTWGNSIGLFGQAEGAAIENIGLTNVDITGHNFTGALVGSQEDSIVSNSYSTGEITGNGHVGGLIGSQKNSMVIDSYNLANVTGGQFIMPPGGTNIGGLVGDHRSNSLIVNCYSTGNVFGPTFIGGLVGFIEPGSIISNSYYNFEEVSINNENCITTGALDSDTYNTWIYNDLNLDIDDYLSYDGERYLITSVDDLKKLLAFSQFEEYSYKLTTSLDLHNHPNFYIPLLAGNFDGNGFVIDNMTVNIGFLTCIGLFGIATGAIIENLGVTNVENTGSMPYFVGGIVGRQSESAMNNCYSTGSIEGSFTVGGLVGEQLSNSTISNSFSTMVVSGDTTVGGLVGYQSESTISNSYSTGSVFGDFDTGGLVGTQVESTISNSYSTGSVVGDYVTGGLVGSQGGSTVIDSYSTANVTGNSGTGGLVGTQVESTISNSYSTGSVFGDFVTGGLVGSQSGSTVSDSYSTGSVVGNGLAGGLVASQSESTISNSYSTGTVEGYSAVGGLVGRHRSSSKISNSSSTGNVNGHDFVGGLAGSVNLNSTITSSYSTGNVSGNNYVGGSVGFMLNNSLLTNSYSIGNVTGDSWVGGLVGASMYSDVTNSYWNTETSGHAESLGGEGRTTDEMTYPYAANTYVDWDFAEIWTADVDYSINQGYPYLQEMPVSVEEEFVTVLESPTLTNFPNPFNPETTISFTLPQEAEKLELKIYNIRGHLVRTLIAGTPHSKGEYRIVWDGRNDFGSSAASGVYFYRVTTPSFNQINKMLLLK